MWKTLRGLGFVYANGNGHGGQSSGRCSRAHRCRGRRSRQHGSVAAAGRCPAACRPTAYRTVTCRAGCPHPAAGGNPLSDKFHLGILGAAIQKRVGIDGGLPGHVVVVEIIANVQQNPSIVQHGNRIVGLHPGGRVHLRNLRALQVVYCEGARVAAHCEKPL